LKIYEYGQQGGNEMTKEGMTARREKNAHIMNTYPAASSQEAVVMMP
jgi:hypothetical protein